MPQPDLRDFIVQRIVQPFLDRKKAEGMRLNASISFKDRENETKPLRWELKGKPLEARFVIQCRKAPPPSRVFAYEVQIEVFGNGVPDEKIMTFALRGLIGRDERCFYFIPD